MARKSNNSETERCVLTLPLCTEPWQEHIIETRFRIMEHLKNQLIAMELRKLKNLRRTKAFRSVEDAIRNAPRDKQKPLYKQRNKMLTDAGFKRTAFQDDMAGKKSLMQKHFAEHIATQIAHEAAKDVWQAFDKYLFSSGREVHFHKRGTLDSIHCQHLGNGMDYKDGLFRWSGGSCPSKIVLNIRVQKPKTEYEKQMLQKEIKYLRIVRKWVKNRYKYYLQFLLVGSPVQKERPIGHGRVGIDIGPQTIAIAAPDFVNLRELADRVNANHAKKCELQRQMDRSRRYTNPANYHPDGTINRKAVMQNHWVYSNHYRSLAAQVHQLERKNADIRKYQHTCLANQILAHGDEIYVEQMSFTGLQHRAKETKQDATGRFLKKKRFGKSLANKAPSSFLLILRTKAAAVGARYQEVDTRAFRASQFDHTSCTFRPALLSERFKVLSTGDEVQRDMYSAFLLMNSAADLNHTDTNLCMQTYLTFQTLQDAEIQRIIQEVPRRPRSFGF